MLRKLPPIKNVIIIINNHVQLWKNKLCVQDNFGIKKIFLSSYCYIKIQSIQIIIWQQVVFS